MSSFSDTHTTQVPLSWDAHDFANQVLLGAPSWLLLLLTVRDKVMGVLGFAPQPTSSQKNVIQKGGTAGPFIFSEVSNLLVRGGNEDRHIAFESTFRVDKDPAKSKAIGVLNTTTHSKDVLGVLYLWAIWPLHKILMSTIIRSGMKKVQVHDR